MPPQRIVGGASDLRSIIDRGPHGGLPPALANLIRTIPANDQVWAALTGGLQSLNLAVPAGSNLANIVSALKTVDTATIGMDLSNGIGLAAEVTCKTERDAKFVHDMLKGVVGIGRLNTPDNHPELLQLYDAHPGDPTAEPCQGDGADLRGFGGSVPGFVAETVRRFSFLVSALRRGTDLTRNEKRVLFQRAIPDVAVADGSVADFRVVVILQTQRAGFAVVCVAAPYVTPLMVT